MAESAVSFLLNNFSAWLQYERNMLGGLGPEVESILDELRHMRAFLRVVDSKEQNDPQLKEWMRQVREIAYDVEDVLDKYKLHFVNHGTNGFSKRIRDIYSSMKGLKYRHQIASQIQTIKSRVKNASASYQTYMEMSPIMDQGEIFYDGRGNALLLAEADVVGIENPKKQLIQWLESTDGGPSIISVVGMPGIGKTTLVKKVYGDKSFKDNFNHHVWITVSELYKIMDLLERMIKLLVDEVRLPRPQCLESKNVDEMREFIYQFLQDKTYVVVLDDIWRIDAWEAIKYAFPRSVTNSRGCIIITTRFNNIGNAASSDTNGHVYILEPLSAEDSKLLFYKKAFPRNPCPPYLQEISESILKRCEGLPLAIVVIGGLLANKDNIHEWISFNNGIGDELGDKLKILKKLISLSFYDLPYYLKSCFLYLSIFPEDELLHVSRLTRLWVVEGFVQEKQGKTVEEVAESYVNELVNRSLAQVVETILDGTPATIRIHDLLREYIISKSRHEILTASNGGDLRRSQKIRRVALDASSINIQESYNFDHLRSIMWFRPGELSYEVISSIRKVLGKCELLKVLNLRLAPLRTIPDEVFKLYHLKFLSLSTTIIRRVPKSITSLINLETLDLMNSEVTQLPKKIVKLKKLRHLIVGCVMYKSNHLLLDPIRGFQGPKDIGLLSSLQTLVYLIANEIDGVKIVTEIGKLTELRTLSLTKVKQKDGNELCSSISKLRKLQYLYICSSEGEVINLEHPMPTSSFPFLRSLLLQGCLEKIPHWTPSLVGLASLNLTWSRLRDEDPLERIQGLPNLRSLEMDLAYEGEELTFRSAGFQRLQRMRLLRLENLRLVKVEEGCMPHIEELGFWDCKLMVEVPEGLRHLLQLQSVEFSNMCEEFVKSVVDQKRKGKNWELSHVPQVNIFGWESDDEMGSWSLNSIR